MHIGWQRITVMGVTALTLCLAGCGSASEGEAVATPPASSVPASPTPGNSVPTPTVLPTRTPIPPEDLQAELWCDYPYGFREISPEEYAWAIQVLENIEPGTTTLEEVELLLGEPADRGYQWLYDPFPDPAGIILLVYYNGEMVDSLSLWSPMTLGQLIETYGEPSRVSEVVMKETLQGAG